MTAAFGRDATALDVVSGHDLTGREAIVTGGASGLGYETARALAAAGARVVIAGRNRDQGTRAAANLAGLTGNPDVVFRHMAPGDLAARGWDDDRPQGWKSPEQGAATSVWAAVAPELDGVGGKYLQDCTIAAPWTRDGDPPNRYYLPYALDAANADRLWTLSEQLVRPPAPSAGTHQA